MLGGSLGGGPGTFIASFFGGGPGIVLANVEGSDNGLAGGGGTVGDFLGGGGGGGGGLAHLPTLSFPAPLPDVLGSASDVPW